MNNEFNDSKNSTFNEASTVNDAGARGDPDAAALARLVAQRREVLFGRRTKPLPPAIGDVMAGANAFAQRFAPDEQKARLVDELRRLVCDRMTGEWLYGFAADLLLVHGQSSRPEAGAIFARMSSLLQEFRDLREVQRSKGQKFYSLGARLNKVVHAICDAYNITTPAKNRISRQAAAAAR